MTQSVSVHYLLPNLRSHVRNSTEKRIIALSIRNFGIFDQASLRSFDLATEISIYLRNSEYNVNVELKLVAKIYKYNYIYLFKYI